jgi:hypothetical protein
MLVGSARGWTVCENSLCRESFSFKPISLTVCKFIFHYQSLIILKINSKPVLKGLSSTSECEVNIYLEMFAKYIYRKEIK